MQKGAKWCEQGEIERNVRGVSLIRAKCIHLESGTLTAGCDGEIKRRQRSDDHARGPQNK
jgi:hypothetical protein